MKALLTEIAEYYSAKIAEHGDTANGVDWNSHESQSLRFEQLTKVISKLEGFSLNDLGCGYGALFDYLKLRYKDFTYNGYDISADMVNAARVRNTDNPESRFTLSSEPTDSADYSVASGIFNVRLGYGDDDWRGYIQETLDVMDNKSRRGFSFNCLTSYSDADKMREYLYYSDPCVLFDYCKRRYSRHVALLHDYGLFEFTILVRKQL